MPLTTTLDNPTLLFEETLVDLLTTCDEDEAVLTWAGSAVVFEVNGEGRLAWRLTYREGGTVLIPQKAAIGIFDQNDLLVETLPVCLEPEIGRAHV